MATTMTITVTDHAACNCTAYYYVEYKLTGDAGYTAMANQLTDTIVIPNLDDDTIYDYRITRFCSNEQVSIVASGTFDTTI